MGRRSRDKGVRSERRLAEIMGGRRGHTYSGKPDVATEVFAVSLKSRKAWPDYLQDAVADAEAKAKKTGKRPLVVLELCRHGVPSFRLYCHPGDEEFLKDHAERRGDEVPNA